MMQNTDINSHSLNALAFPTNLIDAPQRRLSRWKSSYAQASGEPLSASLSAHREQRAPRRWASFISSSRQRCPARREGRRAHRQFAHVARTCTMRAAWRVLFRGRAAEGWSRSLVVPNRVAKYCLEEVDTPSRSRSPRRAKAACRRTASFYVNGSARSRQWHPVNDGRAGIVVGGLSVGDTPLDVLDEGAPSASRALLALQLLRLASRHGRGGEVRWECAATSPAATTCCLARRSCERARRRQPQRRSRPEGAARCCPSVRPRQPALRNQQPAEDLNDNVPLRCAMGAQSIAGGAMWLEPSSSSRTPPQTNRSQRRGLKLARVKGAVGSEAG